MNPIERKLRELISDEASFEFLQVILLLIQNRQNSLIPFSQMHVIDNIENSEDAQFNKLKSLILRFDGLCEVICNAVIADDLMGNSGQLLRSQIAEFKKELLTVKPGSDQTIQLIYKALTQAYNPYEKISFMHLHKFSYTHSLDVGSYFEHMNAYFLEIYPFGLFSYEEKVQKGKKIDREVFGRKLNALEDKSYVKFMTINKTWTGLNGHTMLIKKTGSAFSFFDPNEGERMSLSLFDLCDCIDFSMRGYQHMAFVDGNKYIESIQDKQLEALEPELNTSSEEQDHIEGSLTELVLSEIEKIVHHGQYSDEEFIEAMEHFRFTIEHSLQNNSSIHLEQPAVDKQCSLRHQRDKQAGKLLHLENIQLGIHSGFWQDLLPEQAFFLYESYSCDPITLLDTCDKRITNLPELCLMDDNIYYLDHQKKKITLIDPTTDHFTEVRDLFNLNLPRKAWEHSEIETISFVLPQELRNDLFPSLSELSPPFPFESIKTPYDVAVICSRLSPSNCQKVFEDHLSYLLHAIQTVRDVRIIWHHLHSIKFEMLYNVIKEKLLDMVQSSEDLKTLLDLLQPNEQASFLNAEMLSRLPNMIHTLGDLADTFFHLTLEQRDTLFADIVPRLPEIIQASNDSAYEFQLALECLTPQQCVVLFKQIQSKLPSLIFEDMRVYRQVSNNLSISLDQDNYNLFIDATQNKADELKINERNTKINNLNSDMKKVEEVKSLFESIQNEEVRAFILDGIKETLWSLLVNSDYPQLDLSIILECTPTAQYETYASDQRAVEALIKSFVTLANHEAELFSKALLSNDDQQIKTIFDRLTQRDTKCCCNRLSFLFNQPTHPLLEELGSFSSFWKIRINKALNLGLVDNQLTNIDDGFAMKLLEYCKSRNSSTLDIKKELSHLKSEIERESSENEFDRLSP